MDYCHQTYGLIQDFTCGECLEVLVDDSVGKDTNGNESGERMVFGWNTILWRSGVCTGKDTGLKQTGKSNSRFVVSEKISPDTGRKRGRIRPK